jgi:tripartite-type tricarboxylate transporter receptor subunit TctC
MQSDRVAMTRGTTSVALAAAAALAALLSSVAIAQPAWPAKPVRMLVGYAPGGPVDIVGRLTSQRLSELLGQAVLVENRPGAGATIAAEAVARAAPDGYTLLTAGGGELTIAPSIYPALAYNPLKDLASIALIASSPLMLVVNPRVPVQDAKGLVALVRSQPGRINFASSGTGSTANRCWSVAMGSSSVPPPPRTSGSVLVAPAFLAGRMRMIAYHTPGLREDADPSV